MKMTVFMKLTMQKTECREECGGLTSCTNPDSMDLWVSLNGCTMNCMSVSCIG